ncbi:MAG: hydroxymethylbilane synthase [Ottowia sp.]|nr:hydroxymethylbilane synthase [Ottowia sp.]
MQLTIATRESRLAMWQAQHVQQRLEALGHCVRLLGMTTQGDRILDRALSQVGGKGLFVKELEAALESGEADLAVHSLKDVPMELPEGFTLAAVLEREDPRDAWVSPNYTTPADLPEGGVIGTSSLRRVALLRALLAEVGRSDVRIEPLRGNLDTRLRKLDEGQYAGIVLAAAGLKRLGLRERIKGVFSEDDMLPAAGQGVLGIEIRSGREDVAEALLPLVDVRAALCTTAERTVSRVMGGSCSMPLAAHATLDARGLHLRAAWGEVEGEPRLLRAEALVQQPSLQAARLLGGNVAAQLLQQGAH